MNSYDINDYLEKKLNDNALYDFNTFFELLMEENEKYNLTAIKTVDEVYEKHFLDSLSVSKFISDGMSVCDVGSGGGMPGIPLKIANRNIKLTFLDSNNKKIDFLKLASLILSMDNAYIYGRAEETSQKFDCVVARGVASLNILLEICANLVKPNGKLIAMKGSNYKEELDAAKNAIEKLGYQLETVDEYELPIEHSKHVNLVFIKSKEHNEKYPRNYAQIKKKPL